MIYYGKILFIVIDKFKYQYLCELNKIIICLLLYEDYQVVIEVKKDKW